MTTTVAIQKKPAPVTITLKLTYQAADVTTIAAFTAEADKAKQFAEEARKRGTVKGTVKIGSQKFEL